MAGNGGSGTSNLDLATSAMGDGTTPTWTCVETPGEAAGDLPMVAAEELGHDRTSSDTMSTDQLDFSQLKTE